MKQLATHDFIRQCLLAAAAILLLCPRHTNAATPDTTMPPDLILIVIDSLRADHLGCYGSPLPTTPTIDTLAASGTRFISAHASSSWTQPSVMSLFTALSPPRHGRCTPDQPHATNTTTLAQVLHNSGYQTVGITANPMTNRRFGYARGFDHYDDYTIAMTPGASLAATAAKTAHDTVVTRLACEWLTTRRDPTKPLFLFIMYMDPHWDYLPPPSHYALFSDDPVPPPRNVPSINPKTVTPLQLQRLRHAYAGEIRYTDDSLARLINTLTTSPRADSTAIVITADHGESFLERGALAHGNNLHDEETHVPLIICPPRSHAITTGTTVTGQVALIDVAPTLLAFANITPPTSWEGHSLHPLLSGGTAPEHPLLLDTRIINGHQRAIRTSSWKVIARPPFTTPTAIYNLTTDPGETNNLVLPDTPIPPAVATLMPLLLPPTGDKP